MRIAALLLIALFSCGCAKERAQVAADARAGIAAAAPHADSIGQAILAGVDARLPAVADVNSADWPSPAMKPESITADPQKYLQASPPEPKRTWAMVAAVATSLGLGALFILQRAGPLIPYVGPFIGAAMSRFPALQPLINLAWNAASHADEVAADKAKTVIAADAGNLLAAAQAANAKPELIAALKVLAA